MTIHTTTGLSNTSASTTVTPPVYDSEEYTVAGVVLKFFEEKAKDVAKALGYIGFWAGQAIPDAPQEVRSFSTVMGDFKNFIGATEIPKKVSEAAEAYRALWTNVTSRSSSGEQVGTAAREVFKKSTSLTNALMDGVDFSSRFIPIESATMTWLKGFNSLATVGGAGNGAVEQLEKLVKTQRHEAAKQILYCVNLARDVSYVAVGALGVFCFASGSVVAPWVWVAFLTSALTFTIGGYFYEKLNDPEGKGKNLNPEVVIKNNLARQDYQRRLAATV